MADMKQVKLPSNAPPLQTLSQSLFPKGVITLINETNLPKDALKEATNMMLYENGTPGPRWGTNWFGTPLPGTGPIDGGGMYQGADGTVQLWGVRNGIVYRSVDNGQTWLTCTGVTFTAGIKVNAAQANQAAGASANYMFLTNGVDVIARFDGSSTLVSYSPIASPTGLTAAKTGLASTAYTFYYRVAAVNNIGTTIGSTTASISVSGLRETWDPTNTGSNYVTLTWTAVTGAVRYDVYMCDNVSDDAANNLFYLDSVGNTTYIDHGAAVPNPNSTVPIQNTTSGPLVAELTFVGSRLVGCRDKNNKYRVWWTGSGPFVGYFSDAYDGGYIDLQKGSQFYPVHVEDYRDGKATPLITVWCDSADGRGCVWQMSLETQSLQGTSYTQPNANKLPGSRGTNAPYSVVNVMNDYVFFNYQALYNLGSRAQFLNLLSTDESSANIRPTLLNGVNPAAAKTTAGYYYRAKIFMSMPFNGSSVNNTVTVFDTERKAWMPNAYTFGMERIFQYTDTSGTQHLLFWKPGDSQFSETADTIQGDYGQAFATSLTTGLLPVNPRDRFAFMYVEQAEVEFSNPQGNINVELIGIERTKGYSTQKTITVTSTVSSLGTGWGNSAWSTQPWSAAAAATPVYAELSAKRYFMVMRDLNAYQWHVTSNSVNAAYLLRQLEIQGTLTDAGMPRQWRVSAH